MRLVRLAWALPALAVLAATAPASAAPRWHLDLKHEPLRRIAVPTPGGESRSFWYLVYTLTNAGETAVQTPLNIWIETDTPYTFRDGFHPMVQHAISRRHARRCGPKCPHPVHSDATKEISGLIKNIQNTVGEAVAAMEDGADEVEAGVQRANEAGQALTDILEGVEQATQQVEEIASAY